MKVDDLPPNYQLFQLSVEPIVDRDLQSVFQGLIWPTAEALQLKASKAALADSDLVDDSIFWIEAVLKPEWLASDLQSRLMAATKIVNGRDAFLARYSINDTQIQIMVTRFALHIGVLPASELGHDATRMFLNLQSDSEIRWTGGPWSTLSIAGFQFEYQRRAVRDWRDSLNCLSDGRAIKFSIDKVQPQPLGGKPNKTSHAPTPQAESQWFETHFESRSQAQ